MHFKTLLGAASVALMTAAPVRSAPIELELNIPSSGKATFFGLNNTLTGTQQASSFEFRGIIDTYKASSAPPAFGSFVFDSGILQSFDFKIINIPGDEANGTLQSFDCDFTPESYSGYAYCLSVEMVISTGQDVFHSKTVQPEITTVPLPAGGLLLLTGLGGLAVAKRRKKPSLL